MCVCVFAVKCSVQYVCEYVELMLLVLMQVRLDPTVAQRHTEVNNSVGVRAGRLSLRYELIYIALCNDRGRDGKARGMAGEIKERIDGGLEEWMVEGER